MNKLPITIADTNLSHAWRRVVDNIYGNPGKEITPFTLSLTGFEESNKVREVLDKDLFEHAEFSIDTVSETIFPQSLYEFFGHDREALYKEYTDNLPRIKKIERSNRRGTYFERLIAFDGKINQLETIILSLQKNPDARRSKLQASIFDPRTDHINDAYQGFPCLQHVTFFISEENGLVLNSFYAIQLLYRKAYGNWLGLINLGKFMANELKLEFERLNCFVGVEQLEITKRHAQTLLDMTD